MAIEGPEAPDCTDADDIRVNIKINGIRVKAKGKSAFYLIVIGVLSGAVYLQSL